MKNLDVKQRLVTIVGFLAAVGVVGLLVMVSGIVPVAASSGHWGITQWVLQFSKSRSVATHSAGIDIPRLDDPALILKGAGHYETGCVQCHGSPIRPASPIALRMTATPPALPPMIVEREPQELFYIVKHGIKFTGMPAWPAENRDDEVWAVVAFLLTLPEMEADTYRQLVTIEPDATTNVPGPHTPGVSPAVLESCNRCHGIDGHGRGSSAFPLLAGQQHEYLLASLKAYASGERHSGIMQPVAAILSERELDELATHFAGLSPKGAFADDTILSATDPEERAAAMDRGRIIAEQGIPDRNVPSCADCHGPGPQPRSPAYPRISGQPADYLILQLKLFQSAKRGGTSHAHLMRQVVPGLTENDLRDVAAFYESAPIE